MHNGSSVLGVWLSLGGVQPLRRRRSTWAMWAACLEHRNLTEGDARELTPVMHCPDPGRIGRSESWAGASEWALGAWACGGLSGLRRALQDDNALARG